ncbi:CHAT domain-containing protein [Spirosoma endophyticum]|uniref:CHAT domain-containing protein n=1 Tax=Spirosoma endophyticum TaxID=662367 RepID=A0A1I2GFK5_9BACT|nr:CHAT domain-containing tetratricopeptide repeat protein [Spirosoma endophyticum]SFF16375.1 CHAT domain-containing protein [Spirosoma endophyticum]
MNRRSVCWLLILCLEIPSLTWAQAALSDKYRQRAELLYTKAKYEEAIGWYKKAYELVRRTDFVRAANLCVDLSSMDYMKNHTRAAADRCMLGLRYLYLSKTSSDSVRFKLFSSLGTFYIALYRADSALYYFRKADALLDQNPRIEYQIPLYVLYHFNNQGNWFFKTGNYKRSLVCLTKAQEMAKKYDFPSEMTYVESNLAGCYDAMGNYKESLIHIFRAEKSYSKNDIQKWRFTSGIGWTLFNLKHYREALIYLSRAERLMVALRRGKKTTDYLADQIHLWRMLSSCYRAINRLAVSDRYISQAIRGYRQDIGDHGPLLAQVLVEKGLLHESRNEPDQALASYQGAIRVVSRDTTRLADIGQNPSFESAYDNAALLLAASQKAALLKKMYDVRHQNAYLNASVATYRFCVGLQQRIRHGIDTDQSQVIFSDRQHALVPDAIAVAFEAYQHQQSAPLRETLFQLFEQSQAGSLREAFRLNDIKPRTIPDSLLEREQKLKIRISVLKKRSIGNNKASAELTACQLEWHELMETYRQDYSAYYTFNYQDMTMSYRTLQQQLGKQAAYVAYVRRGASLFILVATNQTLDVIRQPIDPVRFDQNLLKLSQELYRDPVLGQYNGTSYAAELYAACIEPIRNFLAGRSRLVISRDWGFNFLPFEVLETGKQSRDFLTNHVAIAYAFSAQSFFNPSQRPVSAGPVLVVAPFTRTGSVEQTAKRQNTAKTLASSEAKARSIGGEVLLGAQASRSNFLKTSLDRPIIYFATHANTDDADPANSYIAFYPGETDKLYTDDIYNLPLSLTGLAVLGACETGSGQTMKGEGILSLARAFAYAGCPSVVTTLWKANDETTSFLTIRLHHYLSLGMATDQALQQARLDFFESPLFPKFDHPYYWANYILLGNYSPVLPADHSSVVYGWLLFMVVFGLVVFWQRQRLRHITQQKEGAS